MQLTIFTSLNSRKKYELLDLKTKLATQTAEMKKCEALAIENPSIVDDCDYKNKVDSIMNQMSQLEKRIKMVNKVNDAANKEVTINKKLDKYLSQPINYTLLANIKSLKIILLPGYKVIVVKCKVRDSNEVFRKQIKTIISSIDESQYLDSIAVRNNGEMIRYKYMFLL